MESEVPSLWRQSLEAWSMACHFLPSAFFQVWGNPMGGALLVAAPHSRLSYNKWLIFWLLHTNSWWRFLGLSFLLFSFKKVRDAAAQLHFHYRLPKLCRPYLIPRNETIIASSCHVDLCPILVIKGGNLCRLLTFMALISYCKSPLSLDSKRAEET